MLSWEGWFSFSLVIGCFILFMKTRIAPDIVTSGALTLLLISDILTPQQAFAGFANTGMLTVAVLYVVVSGLTETGAVHWLGQVLLGRPRTDQQAQWHLMIPVAALSAFLNNTPVVAIFIPAVLAWAKRQQLCVSKLLIPLSYASIAGGLCTLFGTSTNLVINGLYQSHFDQPGFGLFDLSWIGIPLVVCVLLFLSLTSRWLLPARSSATASYADVRHYTVEMRVAPGSPLVGKSIEQAGLRQLPGLFLIEIERDQQILPAVSSKERLQGADRLIFVGGLESVIDLQRIRGLIPAADQIFKLESLRQDRCFVEVVVSAQCPLIGKTVREGQFRSHYHAVIIAVSRNGERVAGKIGTMTLAPGDTLLLECHPEFIPQQRASRDFLVVSQFGDEHPLRHERAPIALIIVLMMIVSVAVGWCTMLEGALLAAGAMLITRCTSGRVARRAPDWQVLIVIATSFGIGTALETTGVANWIAVGLVNVANDNAWLSLTGVFIATALLTALATNNVAAVLSFPIALDAAQQLQLNPEPFMIVLMVAASASFATPIGYQTNLMVFNVGGYRFSDFIKIGFPLTVVVGFVTVILTPLIWPF
jgi:di/tricarboxylate transporter